jgi:glycosyltransferase involved in cell wall biosynthesis
MPDDTRELRVLARPAFSNRAKNPYNFLLYSGLRARGVTVDEYHPRNWLFRRYDLCHVHWPESTFNASLAEALATTRTLLLTLDWLRARRCRIVWTAHNVAAHEGRYPKAEAAFWRAFTPRVDAFFALSEASREEVRARFPELRARPAFVVPHHHYRGEYPDGVSQSQARARLDLPQDARIALFFGRVLEYKNVPALIDAFRALPPSDEPALLVVAGKPNDRASERSVRRAASADPRVRLHLHFVPQEAAQLWFRASDLVVLPYREILNSGSAVLALGFDRPVLLPRAGAGSELARESGSRWVQLYDELEPALLHTAFARARSLPKVTDGRHLSALSPESAVARTLAAYRTIAGRSPEPRSAAARARVTPESPWLA